MLYNQACGTEFGGGVQMCSRFEEGWTVVGGAFPVACGRFGYAPTHTLCTTRY